MCPNILLDFERGEKKNTILTQFTTNSLNSFTGGALMTMIPSSSPPSQANGIFCLGQTNRAKKTRRQAQ